MLRRSDCRDLHMATEISEHSQTFWYVVRLVRRKNPGPLRFELTRFRCMPFIREQVFFVDVQPLTPSLLMMTQEALVDSIDQDQTAHFHSRLFLDLAMEVYF